MTDAQQQEALKARGNLPRHIAIIMDGNGRWAKQHAHRRITGHRHGVEAVRDVVRASAELGIEVLSLYVFSRENWNRPRQEVLALMRLLRETVLKETGELNANNVQLMTCGRTYELPENARTALQNAIEATSGNDGLVLNLAINYSGRAELTDALAALIREGYGADDITDELVANHLYTRGLPDPDLLIRTSGEMRISNFLLWQVAYTELLFPNVYWPDFRRGHLYEAIRSYQQRQRRFGMTGDQLYVNSEQEPGS